MTTHQFEIEFDIIINAFEIDMTNAIKEVFPKMDDLEITPTFEEQNFSGSYGNVKVNAVEGKHLDIIPTNNEQSFEGIYTKVNVGVVQSEELSITPSIEDKIEEGLFNKITVYGDENLIPENIKQGVSIFGVNGVVEEKEESSSEYNALISNPGGKTDFQQKDWIIEVGEVDLTGVTKLYNSFYQCANLRKAPVFKNCESVTQLNQTFYGCSALSGTLSLECFQNLTTVIQPFYNCEKLQKVILGDTSKITNLGALFFGCASLEEVNEIDCSSNTNLERIFWGCKKLKEIKVKNTSLVTSIYQAFSQTIELTTIPQMDTGAVKYTQDMVYNAKSLVNIGGFVNLGKGFTQKTANYANHTVNFSYCTALSHDSLMNVINGLYDLNLTYNVAGGGTLYSQSLVLGSTNLAKLTAQEIRNCYSKAVGLFHNKI